MSKTLYRAVLSPALMVACVAAAIAFGGPAQPPLMASINDPFKSVEHGDLPPMQRLAAPDGVPLSFRAHAAINAPRGSVLLVHGSYEALFADAGRPIAVTLLPDVNPIGMTLQGAALAAVVAAMPNFAASPQTTGEAS